MEVVFSLQVMSQTLKIGLQPDFPPESGVTSVLRSKTWRRRDSLPPSRSNLKAGSHKMPFCGKTRKTRLEPAASSRKKRAFPGNLLIAKNRSTTGFWVEAASLGDRTNKNRYQKRYRFLNWSGRRGSNSLPPTLARWRLPDELLPRNVFYYTTQAEKVKPFFRLFSLFEKTG